MKLRNWILAALFTALTAVGCLIKIPTPISSFSPLFFFTALSALLLPPETPLLLDDALLTFDADRTAAALTQLRQAGRQVLLFTCRKLEEPQ